MAIAHSGYYAMFHAARAVLFLPTGTAPKRHDRTIQQFGLLAQSLDDSLRAAGKAFNEAKDERNDADYTKETGKLVPCRHYAAPKCPGLWSYSPPPGFGGRYVFDRLLSNEAIMPSPNEARDALNRVHFENRGSVGPQPGNAPATRHLGP